MKYNFNPSNDFLGIKTNYHPEQVVKILGNPEDVKKQTYSSSELNDFDITYYYNKGQIRIVFSYVNGIFSGLSIYSKSIYIDNINLFSIHKSDVLNIIGKISNIDIEKACKDKVKINDYYSEEFEFYDIGLTLWFEGNVLEEVCVFK